MDPYESRRMTRAGSSSPSAVARFSSNSSCPRPVEVTESLRTEPAGEGPQSAQRPTEALSAAETTEQPQTMAAQEAERLAKHLEATARDGTDPDAFEQAIAECFDLLGFHSQ